MLTGNKACKVLERSAGNYQYALVLRIPQVQCTCNANANANTNANANANTNTSINTCINNRIIVIE